MKDYEILSKEVLERLYNKLYRYAEIYHKTGIENFQYYPLHVLYFYSPDDKNIKEWVFL